MSPRTDQQSRARDRVRALVRAGRTCAPAVLVAAIVATTGSSFGASSGTVVNATVPASIQVDDTGCLASASREFGNALPGSPVLTSACRIDFHSSNESAMLRMSRRSLDATRPTMTRDSWTFTQQRAATGVALNDIDAYSSDVAWAVGNGGTILKTTNGGTTWPAQASGVAEHLETVLVVDASTVWVVGNAGRVLRTTNGGTSWSPINAGTAVNLHDIDIQDGTVWISGDGGVVRRSSDNGTTWSAAGGGMTGTVYAVDAVTKDVTIAATSAPNEIWRTTNRGQTWTLVHSTSGCGWQNLDSPSPTVVYAAACNNIIGVSTDAGATWTVRTDAWSEGDDLEAPSPMVAYVTDISANIERTYDGLATLPFHSTATGIGVDRITGLAVPSIDLVWFTAEDGTIARSQAAASVSDYAGGANWSSGASTSTFGVCVQSIGGTTTPIWAADTTGIAGTCEANDTDTWRAIPTTPTKIAATAIGAQGRIDLVWGMRAASGQPPGRYFAPVTFEALAPNI